MASDTVFCCERLRIGKVFLTILLLLPHWSESTLICLQGSATYDTTTQTYREAEHGVSIEAGSCRVVCLQDNSNPDQPVNHFISWPGTCDDPQQICDGVTSTSTKCLGVHCCSEDKCNLASTASCNPLNEPETHGTTPSEPTIPEEPPTPPTDIPNPSIKNSTTYNVTENSPPKTDPPIPGLAVIGIAVVVVVSVFLMILFSIIFLGHKGRWPHFHLCSSLCCKSKVDAVV